MSDDLCAVCGGPMVNAPTGRDRVYCSDRCRARAVRDRRRGRMRLFGANDPPDPVRPGLRHVARGVYETRDGGTRIESDGRRWTVVLIVNGLRFPAEPTYPTLRAARHAVGVDTRRDRGW